MLTAEYQADQSSAIGRSVRRAHDILIPREKVRGSEWAKRHFRLPNSSASAFNPRPTQIAVLDLAANRDVHEIDRVKPARTGGTVELVASCFMNMDMFHSDSAIWLPSDTTAQRFSKREIKGALRECKTLHEKHMAAGGGKSDDTIEQKVLSTCYLMLLGGEAERNYRSMTLGFAGADELSAFQPMVEGLGSPGPLMRRRLQDAAYPKFMPSSTPGIEGKCQITELAKTAEANFEFHCACPHCGHLFAPVWGGEDASHGITFAEDGDFLERAKTAHYVCPECGDPHTYTDMLVGLHHGRWQTLDGSIWLDDQSNFCDEHGAIDPIRHIALRNTGLTSHNISWVDAAKQFFTATKSIRGGDTGPMREFTTQYLAEPWVEMAQATVRPTDIRQEDYPADGLIPSDVLSITAWADMQKDRSEIQIKGWGVGEESWGLDYIVLPGSPDSADLWQRIAEQFRREFINVHGEVMPIALCGIDHGGHWADKVERFCRDFDPIRCIPTKGDKGDGRTIARFPRKRNRRGVYLTMISTHPAKDTVYQRLPLTEAGPGCMHYPLPKDGRYTGFGPEFFKGVTSERKIRLGNGAVKWVLPNGRDNEPLDTETGNLALIRVLQAHYQVKLEPDEIETNNTPSLAELLAMRG